MENRSLNLIKAAAPFELPPLPYPYNALEPYVSEKTLSFHHDKHHHKYISTTNELIKGTEFEKFNLEEIIKATAGNAVSIKLFNNAAQSWNHWFYWNCMKPQGGQIPKGRIKNAIESSFGSYDNFAKEFSAMANDQFGSGYAWLVMEGDKLKVTKTSNADNPIAHNQKPILAIDVWEHAYYLDYQNKRQDYVMAFVNNCIDWEFAEFNLK